jgi:hypothetical protein
MLRPEPATSLTAGRFAQTLFNKVGGGLVQRPPPPHRPSTDCGQIRFRSQARYHPLTRITPFPCPTGVAVEGFRIVSILNP